MALALPTNWHKLRQDKQTDRHRRCTAAVTVDVVSTGFCKYAWEELTYSANTYYAHETLGRSAQLSSELQETRENTQVASDMFTNRTVQLMRL